MIVLFNGTVEKDGGYSKGGRYVASIIRDDYGIKSECKYGASPNDFVVGWGYQHSAAILNGRPRNGKLWELKRLDSRGVCIPRYTVTRPDPPQGWLGRTSSHQGGVDLLNPPEYPDFWTKFTKTVLEYRAHIFITPDGTAESKLAVRLKRREDAHPWMRNTWEGGWGDYYETSTIMEATRNAKVDLQAVVNEAAKAVQAMDYQFGAVDVAWKPDGSPIIWEVNSQPEVPGPETADFYARNIVKYFKA